MLFGFMGQLKPKYFPQEYSDVRDALRGITPTQSCENSEKSVGGCYTFLYFPWYSYIGLRWIEKTTMTHRIVSYITNPWQSLYGDNDIIGDLWSTSIRPESKTIERFIRRQ